MKAFKRILIISIMLFTLVGCANRPINIVKSTKSESDGSFPFPKWVTTYCGVIQADQGSSGTNSRDTAEEALADVEVKVAQLWEDGWTGLSYCVYKYSSCPVAAPVRVTEWYTFTPPEMAGAINLTIVVNCPEGISAKLYLNNEKCDECSEGGSINYPRIALDQLFRIDLEAAEGYSVDGFDFDKTKLQITNINESSISFRCLANQTFTFNAR